MESFFLFYAFSLIKCVHFQPVKHDFVFQLSALFFWNHRMGKKRNSKYSGVYRNRKKNKSEKERKMSKPNSAENTLKQLYQTTLLLYQFACDPFKKCVHLLFSSLFFYRIFVLYLSFETSSFFLDRNSFYLYSQKFLRLAKALWIIWCG